MVLVLNSVSWQLNYACILFQSNEFASKFLVSNVVNDRWELIINDKTAVPWLSSFMFQRSMMVSIINCSQIWMLFSRFQYFTIFFCWAIFTRNVSSPAFNTATPKISLMLLLSPKLVLKVLRLNAIHQYNRPVKSTKLLKSIGYYSLH